MKRILSILLLMATLLSAFSITAFADDNATGGDGTTHGASDGYGWYNTNEFMWKVTLFVTPDKDSPSAEYDGGRWKMKSGYGFTVSYAPAIVSVDGTTKPTSSAYTEVQRAEAFFPEFKYSTAQNSFRTLEKASGKWQFEQNEYADGKERMHFTPIWYPDGNYSVAIVATDVWTPSGMIESRRNSNVIAITESVYDDWYIR